MADKVEKKIYKRWQTMTGKHSINGKTYPVGKKFITEANMNVFNTDPQKPKYKDLGEVSEKEYLDWVASEGASTTDGSTALPITQEDADNEPADTLQAMTIADLEALAEDEGIDLTGKHRKPEILAAIREARAAADEENDE